MATTEAATVAAVTSAAGISYPSDAGRTGTVALADADVVVPTDNVADASADVVALGKTVALSEGVPRVPDGDWLSLAVPLGSNDAVPRVPVGDWLSLAVLLGSNDAVPPDALSDAERLAVGEAASESLPLGTTESDAHALPSDGEIGELGDCTCEPDVLWALDADGVCDSEAEALAVLVEHAGYLLYPAAHAAHVASYRSAHTAQVSPVH
jgi:hypothetical protein